jgi:hypothetical protein
MLHLPLQGADFYFLSCSAGKPSAPRGGTSTIRLYRMPQSAKRRASPLIRIHESKHSQTLIKAPRTGEAARSERLSDG